MEYVEDVDLYDIVRRIEKWNCEDINDLISYIQDLDIYIKNNDYHTRIEDVIDISSLPIADAYEERVAVVSAYPVWTCDKRGRCLVDLSYYDVRDIEEIEAVET